MVVKIIIWFRFREKAYEIRKLQKL